MLFSYKLFFSPGHLHSFLHSSSHTCFDRSQVRGSVSVTDQLSLAAKQSPQDSAKKCICRLRITNIFKRNWQQWNKRLYRKNVPYFVNKYQTVSTLTWNETAYKNFIYICRITSGLGQYFCNKLKRGWIQPEHTSLRSFSSEKLESQSSHSSLAALLFSQLLQTWAIPRALAELPVGLSWSH